MALYIDDLSKYSDYLVTIICGNKDSTIKEIVGVCLDEDMDFSMDAEFDESDISAGIDAAKAFLGKGAEAIGMSGVAKAIDKRYNSILQSAKGWQGGSRFSFTVNFNVFKNSKEGVSNCPTYSSFFENLSKLTQAKPGGLLGVASPQVSWYDSIVPSVEKDRIQGFLGAKESNLFTVKIGNWFECGLLQPTKVDFKLSHFVDTSGSPIFASCSIGFQTYRVLDSSEWSKIVRL